MRPSINSLEFSKAISVQEMREGDAYTIKNYISSKELMYKAALGVYESINWKNKKIAIITGSGNNGGDGYALANILKQHGINSRILRVSDKFSSDGKYYYEKCIENKIEIDYFCENTILDQYDIIVDCILGTGFHGTPNGIIEIAINQINSSNAYVVSVDINSGINGDTGEAVLAVKSNKTVSIGYYKKGLFLNQAPNYIEDLVNVDIGIILPKGI